MVPQPPVATAASPQQALAALEASGAERFSPARFHYIKSLLNRGEAKGAVVAAMIANKALALLAAYQQDLARARAEAETLVQQLVAQDPAAEPALRSLLQAGDFRALRRREILQERPAGTAQLAALVTRLARGTDASAPDSEQAGSFGERLQLQEDAVVAAIARAAGDTPAPVTTGMSELKSARMLQTMRQQQQAEQRVTRMQAEAPQDSGPLNPQKLAIRSLATMRALSPAYLARLVAYIDTLFWLENSRAKGDSK